MILIDYVFTYKLEIEIESIEEETIYTLISHMAQYFSSYFFVLRRATKLLHVFQIQVQSFNLFGFADQQTILAFLYSNWRHVLFMRVRFALCQYK